MRGGSWPLLGHFLHRLKAGIESSAGTTGGVIGASEGDEKIHLRQDLQSPEAAHWSDGGTAHKRCLHDEIREGPDKRKLPKLEEIKADCYAGFTNAISHLKPACRERLMSSYLEQDRRREHHVRG
jgi:hypothetical protein